jgi:small subunit ribosomal protein S18
MKESPRRKGNSRPRRTVVKRYHTKGVTFSYREVSSLTPFITEQGSLIPRAETGLSQQQQRQLTSEVKRARHLALLPFTQTL